MSKTKLALFLTLLAGIAAIIWWLPADLLTLESLKARQAEVTQYRSDHPSLIVWVFLAVYIVFTALSIPGATILTLASGAIFGVVMGTVWVSIASTIGATLAFLMSRYFFKNAVQAKFGDRLGAIEENLKKDGAFYLFSMRLVPVIPFFVINLVMGLTPIKTATYAFASWAGMLAGTAVYVNAGTQLAKLNSLNDILSAPIILSFVLLATFPFIARRLIQLFRK
ncbi:MAG: TVP38/TMEM64 family protein [Arenicellales bacterium]